MADLPEVPEQGRRHRVTLHCELVAEPGRAPDVVKFVEWLNAEMASAEIPARFIRPTRRTGAAAHVKRVRS